MFNQLIVVIEQTGSALPTGITCLYVLLSAL